MIKQVLIGEEGKKICLTMYLCDNYKAVLFVVPGLSWYYIGSNRFIPRLAKKSLEKKISLITFDYLNHGESDECNNCYDYKEIMYAYKLANEYIKENFYNIVAIGIGIGNNIISNEDFDNYIFCFIKKMKVYDKKYLHDNEILYVEDNRDDKNIQSLIGPFHDCLYNNLDCSYNSILKFLSDPNWKRIVKKTDDKLLITGFKPKKNLNNCNYVYVNEFGKNIFPSDWQMNNWPQKIEYVNDVIIDWVNSKYDSTNSINLKKLNLCNISFGENSFMAINTLLHNEECILYSSHYPYNKSKSLVIFIPGLGGDKLESHKFGHRLGTYMSKHGHILFRADTYCSGASLDDLSNYDYKKIIEWYKFYIKLIINKHPNCTITFLSWSEGAKYVLDLLHEFPCVKCAYLINPVLVSNEPKENKKNKVYKVGTRKYAISTAGEYLNINYFKNKKDYLNILKNVNVNIRVLFSKNEIGSNNYNTISSIINNIYINNSNHHLLNYSELKNVFNDINSFIEERI